MNIPKFENHAQLVDFFKKNKDFVIAEKKNTLKTFVNSDVACSDEMRTKDVETEELSSEEIRAFPVISTTNVMDSHDDVHFPGVWKKSLKENAKNILHLQEHRMRFDHLISKGDDLKAFTESISWKDLGFKFSGNTEALTFDSLIKRKINALMFDMYREKNVDQHSVGMRYVKISLGINDEDFPEAFKVWKSKIDEIVNKDKVIKQGYFFAVFEAKLVEGSAVLRGSNQFTPTQSVSNKSELIEIKNQIIELKNQIIELKNMKPSCTHDEPQKNKDTFDEIEYLRQVSNSLKNSKS